MPDIFDQLTSQTQTAQPAQSAPAQSVSVPTSAGTPAQSTGDIFDQLASGTYKEQTPPAPSLASKVGDAVSKYGEFENDVSTGLWKGAGQTVGTVSNLINKIPVIGESLAPKAGVNALEQATTPTNTAQKVGVGAEGIAEFFLGDEALKGLSIAKKLGIAKRLAELAEESPRTAAIIQHGLASLRAGTVVTGQQLAHGATLPQALETGGEAALAGTVTGAAVEGAGALKNAVTPMVEPIVKGEKVAQPAAQAALRASAGSADTSVSLRKVMQPSVDNAFTEAKSLYKPIDEAAGTDFKGLYDKLDAAMDKERLTAAGSPEQAKAELDIKTTQDAISDARATAAKAGIPDVDASLSQADAKFTEAQANKDLNAKLFNNQSVVKGNLKYGAPETIDVDKAIDALENLDKPNKYGASRLRQTSLGNAGADKLLQDLYNAQKLGQKAVSKQQFARWAGGLLGVGTAEEVLRHTLGH